MRRTKIIYWIFTGLFAAMMLFSSIPNIMSSPESVAFFKNLGYPSYIIPFLGVAKVLGVIGIVIPGFPRVKEWAYAGLSYDLIGAVYSIIATGAPASGWWPMLIFIFIAAGSYIFYHKKVNEDLMNGIPA